MNNSSWKVFYWDSFYHQPFYIIYTGLLLRSNGCDHIRPIVCTPVMSKCHRSPTGVLLYYPCCITFLFICWNTVGHVYLVFPENKLKIGANVPELSPGEVCVSCVQCYIPMLYIHNLLKDKKYLTWCYQAASHLRNTIFDLFTLTTQSLTEMLSEWKC